ncbi:MAG: hypothetical protein ACXV3S_06890 [Kineosporiaceae bacterium]
MSTSWVAGSVRAKALAGRRLGAAGARALASSPDLAAALDSLAATPYGREVHPGQSLAQAQHGVAAAVLWNARVLAGWLPRHGAQVVRVLAAGFEVANLDEHLAGLLGRPAGPTYALGTVATAWPRLVATTTLPAADDVLAESPWHVRAKGDPREMLLGVRLAWAGAVALGVPEAAGWARAAASLLVVRETALEGRGLSAEAARRATVVLGPAFVAAVADPAVDLAGLRAALPGSARWVLDAVRVPEDLWLAEAVWWRRVERDGFALIRGSGYDRSPVVGALAVLAGDAWRVRAALETVVRGGTGRALEAFDGVA